MLRMFLRLHLDAVGNEDLIDRQAMGWLFAFHQVDPGFKTSVGSWMPKGFSQTLSTCPTKPSQCSQQPDTPACISHHTLYNPATLKYLLFLESVPVSFRILGL